MQMFWQVRAHLAHACTCAKRYLHYTTIAESAAKELESLAVHMPNVSHSDARALALRMYYIEVSNEMSPTDAQTNVSHMFQNYRTHLVCVQRGTPILWLHSLR